MTHLIISIEDIEAELEALYPKVIQDKDDQNRIKSMYFRLQRLLEESKRISLTEEDIEAKAVDFAENGDWSIELSFIYDNFKIRKEAYSLALKHLL